MSMGTRGRKMAGGRRTILRIAWKLSCYPSWVIHRRGSQISDKPQ
jgi:hypothetical protein